MARSVFVGETGRILVAEDAQQEPNEVPNTDEDAIVAPVACLGYQLCIQDRWTEWEDSQYDETDILAAILDGYNFSCASECDELVQSSTDAREDLTS
jgi:hypothetical protein